MAEPTTPHRLPTVDEYPALEKESAVRHEYVAGMIYAHAACTSRHNAISANVSRSGTRPAVAPAASTAVT